MKRTVKTMRDVFIEGVYNRMQEDESIFFLTADFGSPKLDQLREDFPKRFMNVGIAEQNLVNVASGLALEGLTVYAYAIAPFLTMRAYEQIRNNLSLLQYAKELNVNLIGVGAGLSYDVSGPTHHCIEDLSIMLTLPKIDVFSPSCWVLCEKFVEHSIENPTVKYLRFDGKPQENIYDGTEEIDFNRGFYQLSEGEGVCLVSTGYMTHASLAAVRELKEEGKEVGLIDIFMLRPFDSEALYQSISKYKYVFSLEEAFIRKGGLDSLVASLLESNDSSTRLKRIGFDDEYIFTMGGRAHMHELKSLDAKSIVKTIKSLL